MQSMTENTESQAIRREYGAEWYGASSVAYALRDIEAGKIDRAVFILTAHPVHESRAQPGMTRYVIAREVDEREPYGSSWRWCGERDDPAGAGSHAVLASWYPQDTAVAVANAVATMASVCERMGWTIYRQA